MAAVIKSLIMASQYSFNDLLYTTYKKKKRKNNCISNNIVLQLVIYLFFSILDNLTSLLTLYVYRKKISRSFGMEKK